jgi:hypothetical protein
MKAVCCLVLALAVQGEDVRRIAELKGEPQRKALRAILADDAFMEDVKNRGAVFQYEDRLRPALRALVSDLGAGDRARTFLAQIGVAEDLRFIISARSVESRPLPNRWAYRVACALLEPDSEEEWSFLRKCALNEYDDRWVDWGAIQTLKLNASPRSRSILEEVGRNNEYRAKSVARALEYIQSNSPPLSGRNLEELAGRVAQVIRIGDWEGNRPPRYNQAGDKALVDLTFYSGSDSLTYTATFHKADSGWKLRGVRETFQAFAPRLAAPKPLVPRGLW